ncbi:MAG: hypothetical protein HFH84_17010 [Lachnospiraceae bacterium]|jgi:hypothetical protein|nr:hypothetical protein [Lachnospiraceae bacterium]
MAKLIPIKAIRAKCLECSNGQYKEVRECTVKTTRYMAIGTVTDPKRGDSVLG